MKFKDIVGAVATAAVATGIGAIAGVTNLTRFFAVNVGLNVASRALAPDIPRRKQDTAAYNVSAISPAADFQIIYGQAKVGGIIVYKETTPTNSNKFLHLVIAVAGHEVESFDSVFLDEDETTITVDTGLVTDPDFLGLQAEISGYPEGASKISKARIVNHNGSDTQEADARLVEESSKWTSQHRLQGIAYSYIRLEYDQDIWVNGEPFISFLVSGKKLYDPRDGTTSFSVNPALALYDYLTSEYGLNCAASEIDEDSFKTAANICDETVSILPSGTQKRYTINGAFTTKAKPNEIIEKIVNCMAGTLHYSGGKWRVKAGAYTTPVRNFDEDDLRSNLSISTRISRRDNFNIVRGTFKGADTNYQDTDFPEVRSDFFIGVDNNIESAVDVELPFTNTSAMAQRLAKIALYKNRQQITVSGSFGMRAFELTVGDIIRLTNSRAGWFNKQFEVVEWSFVPDAEQGFLVNLVLRETSSTIYDWSRDVDETAFELDNTNLVSPFAKPDVSMAFELSTQVINEHVTNVLDILVTSSQPERVDYVTVEFKKSSETNFRKVGVGELGRFEIIDIDDDEYDFRVRAVTVTGIRGDFVNKTKNIGIPKREPADPTGFRAALQDGSVTLSWDASTDNDLSYYEVRHAKEESGATWPNSTIIVEKVARPATSVVVSAKPGTYLIKAYNKQNRPSLTAQSAVIESNALRTYANTVNVTEHTSFSGTQTDTEVVSSKLSLSDDADTLVFIDAQGQPSVIYATLRMAYVKYLTNPASIPTDLRTIFEADFGGYEAADLNQDGNIDLLDALILIGYYHNATQTYADRIKTNLIDPIIAKYNTGSYNFTTAASGDVREGTYEFNGTFSHSSDVRFRARIDVEVQRDTDVSGTFDTILLNWDEWEGNWDDWTGSGISAGDVDVDSYINPRVGGVYQGWQKIEAADLYGDGAKFKVVLKSLAPGIEPEIDYLQAVVGYD
jgi:hypothetical protein